MLQKITDKMIQKTVDTATAKAIVALRGDESGRNILNDGHERLVRAMVETLADSVLGGVPNRITVAADTGLGKSTVCCAFVASVAEHFPDETGIGILVLHSQISEGAEVIERTLGMAADREELRLQIAHVHSKRGGVSGMSPGNGRQYRFVFATHSRAYLSSMAQLLRWNAKVRGVIIDEGLHKADPFGVNIRDLRGACGWASEYMIGGPHEDSIELRDWMQALREKVEDAREDLKTGEHRMFRHTRPKSVDRIIGKLEHLKRASSDKVLDTIIGLLRHSNLSTEFRMIPAGVVQSRRALPEEMLNAVILDAGADIDRLQQLDEEVIEAEAQCPERWDGVPLHKDWSRVTVHHMETPSGRGTVDQTVGARGWLVDVFADKIAEVYLKHPDWQILVCTLQARKVDAAVALKDALEDRAIGRDASSDRLKWITYGGDHKGTNAFRTSRAVFSFGTWNISNLQAYAAWLGAKAADPEDNGPDGQETSRVAASHTVAGLFQLCGRGNCRNVENLVAGEMEFYYATSVSRVRRMFHGRLGIGEDGGAKLVEWKLPQAGSEAKRTVSRTDVESKKLEDAVVEVLKTTSKGSILIKDLWETLRAPTALKRKRTRILTRALKRSPGWIRQGSGRASRILSGHLCVRETRDS